MFRRYNLDYGTSASLYSGRKQLRGIQECVSDSTDEADCLPKVTFDWNSSLGTAVTKRFTAASYLHKYSNTVIDMNGDGHSDFFYYGDNTWKVRWGNAWTYAEKYRLRQSHHGLVFSGKTSYTRDNLRTIDVDGDGIREMLMAKDYNGWKWYIVRYNDSTNTFTEQWVMNGDRRGDLPTMRPMDINGDGLEDLVYEDNGTYKYRLNEYDGTVRFSTAETTLLSATTGNSWASLSLNSGDMKTSAVFDANGDGRSDLVSKVKKNGSEIWAYFISNGTRLEYVSTLADSWNDLKNPQFADFNGDGLSDLIYQNRSDEWQLRLSHGVGFTAVRSLGGLSLDKSPSKVRIMDIDNDGRAEIVRYAYPNNDRQWASYNVYYDGSMIQVTSSGQVYKLTKPDWPNLYGGLSTATLWSIHCLSMIPVPSNGKSTTTIVKPTKATPCRTPFTIPTTASVLKTS